MLHQLVTPEAMAGLLVRIFTGILFFFQGYDKFFRMGIGEVVLTIQPAYRKIGLPDSIIKLFAYLTSFIELAGGFLLLIGFLKFYALYALGLDLLIVAIGMSILNPTWDLQHVFPRLLLVIFLMILPSGFDIFTLDHFVF
ncbi:hypothetical protein BH11BAC2_BH11BAC2_15510 [soil metagenome]